ncbi:MAG: ABC transporter substrate-binding protein, partial [Acidimicrobiia bacterium]
MRKRLPILAVLLSLALIAGACAESTEDTTTTTTTTTEAASPGTTAAQTTTTTEAAGPKTIIIGTTDTIASLDPGDAYSVHDWELIKNTGEGLLGWEPGELTLRTGLATDFPEVSDDGLTYTFTLRDGIQFGDGTELTASMYAESLNRLLTIGPDCPNGVANALATPFIESITAPDESTMVFQLTRPVAFFPQLTATATFIPGHPDTFPADECVLFPEAPIYGVGPWYISEYTQAEQTVLEPNPYYTGDLTPNVDRIIIRYFSDPQTMALAVQNGEIDVAWRLLGPELVAELG